MSLSVQSAAAHRLHYPHFRTYRRKCG